MVTQFPVLDSNNHLLVLNEPQTQSTLPDHFGNVNLRTSGQKPTEGLYLRGKKYQEVLKAKQQTSRMPDINRSSIQQANWN